MQESVERMGVPGLALVALGKLDLRRPWAMLIGIMTCPFARLGGR